MRRDRHGYQQRLVKVRDTGPQRERWIPFARHVWQRRNGPVPRGMFVVHADGNTLNDDPENLMLMSRHELTLWQRTIRPRMEAKRRRAAGLEARRRWRQYRAIRAARKEKTA